MIMSSAPLRHDHGRSYPLDMIMDRSVALNTQQQVMLRKSPKGSHESVGGVENRNYAVEAQVRTASVVPSQ